MTLNHIEAMVVKANQTILKHVEAMSSSEKKPKKQSKISNISSVYKSEFWCKGWFCSPDKGENSRILKKGQVRTRVFNEIEPSLKTFISQGEEEDKVGNKGRGRTWRHDKGLTR